MNQIIDFFSRLFDTSDWPPRWQCGNWTDFHGWLYILSDLAIWGAYMAIPLLLIRYIFVKQGVPLTSIFWLFGAFILLCGFTHLLDVTMFYWPAYRFNALIRFLTGLVSIGTVVALYRHFDEALGLRTSQEYERELKLRQQTMQELRRSNEELQQFAYVASHDLQSPLRTIENYLSLFDDRYGGSLDENARKLLSTSVASAGRMRLLINDLLTFSTVGSSADFETFSLKLLVQEVCEEIENDIRESGARIEIGELPKITAHRTDFKRLFQNLLSNAVKYRRKDVPPHIRIQCEPVGDNYLFSVSDNGIGIDPAHFGKLFQIFQRLHGRTQYQGTGIGLATCKKIVEIYGGSIRVESQVGQGSTFYFTVPKTIKPIRHYVQENQLHTAD